MAEAKGTRPKLGAWSFVEKTPNVCQGRDRGSTGSLSEKWPRVLLGKGQYAN